VAGGRRSRRLAGLRGWIGFGSATRLEGNLAVISPHLDDGILSLGAAIAAAHGDVAIVTVLAGDPASELPAGEWDGRAGFATAGEATRARREEDRQACAVVGARPVWLPFSDHQYPRGGGDDDVWAQLEQALGDAESVLVPGHPLLHEDHAWIAGLVRARGLPGRRIGRYVEQPYASAWSPAPAGWAPVGADLRHRLAKLRACRRYASQLPLMPPEARSLVRLARYEAAHGGEAARWD
jgi:LmbE family N-acetylglucosaminyl deacetylase